MTNEIALIKNNFTGLRIREQDEKAIKSAVSVIVEEIFTFAGQTPQKEDVKVICREICSDLQKRYKGMTLSEVDYALKAGAKGDYGEYFGINVISISKWLKAYYNSDERKEAQRSAIFAELPQHTQPTEEEILIAQVNACIRAADIVKAGGYAKDYGGVVYNYLDEAGEINFTKKEKIEFMNLAKLDLEREAKKQAKDSKSPVPLSHFLERITETGIKQRAKRIALNVHLRKQFGKTDTTKK